MTNTLGLKKRLITEISGGERQRVIIAKALAQEPSMIFRRTNIKLRYKSSNGYFKSFKNLQ